MRPIRILTVCGSGTVSSSMISTKLKDRMRDEGYEVMTVEVNSGGVPNAVSSGKFDLIAYTSPISGKYSIPVVNAVGLLTGFGEEEVLEKILTIAESIKDL